MTAKIGISIGLVVSCIAIHGTILKVWAHNQVVVIPLKSEIKCTGNATSDDVVKDKTFSNSSGVGLTGKRPPASVQRTGQGTSYYVGDDGAHLAGVGGLYPRFSVGQYHVVDTITGLMWQKFVQDDHRTWSAALFYCNQLELFIAPSGGGLGYTAGDWRLPNLRELQSLINYKYTNPALYDTYGTGQWTEGNPFTGIRSHNYYWSSTTAAANTSSAWAVSFAEGYINYGAKGNTTYAICVRGGD